MSLRLFAMISLVALVAAVGCGDDDSPTPDANLVDVMTGGPDAFLPDAAPPPTACEAAVPADPDSTIMGNNTKAPNNSAGQCQLDVGGGGGHEVVYEVVATVDGEIRATLDSTTDLGVYAQTTCGDIDTEVGCADRFAGNSTEVLVFPVTNGMTYFITVDGYMEADQSAFTLVLEQLDTGGACAAATVATLGANSGTTVGGSNFFAGGCTGAGSPEALYSFTPGVAGETGNLTLTVTAATDLGVYVKTDCRGDQTTVIGCADSAIGGANEVLTVPVAGGAPLTIFVDGFHAGTAGPFVLDLAYAAASCGDATVSGFEQCEPPSTATCDATCQAIPQPESECGDLNDNDGDGIRDCLDSDCAGTATCTPGAGLSGTPCDDSSDCSATASDPFCWTEAAFGWPSGSCSEQCDATTDPCPTGSLCVGLGDGAISVCVESCTTPADCTSAGYACGDVGVGMGCVPGCTIDAECPGTTHCDVATGSCRVPETGTVACTDTVDNDLDRDFDCGDADCLAEPTCPLMTETELNDMFADADVYTPLFRAAISPGGDMDWVRLDGVTAGATIDARVGDGGSGGCASLALDSEVEILGSDGSTSLVLNDDISGTNWCSRAVAVAATAGTYYVRAASSQTYAPDDTFTYDLAVQITP